MSTEKIHVGIVQKNGHIWEMLHEKKRPDQCEPGLDSQATLQGETLGGEVPRVTAFRIINEQFGKTDPVFSKSSNYAMIPWPLHNNTHLLCLIDHRTWRGCVTGPAEPGGQKKEWEWKLTNPPNTLLTDAAMVEITGR
jgi:hypothetical protein